jgi:hypothetical protein
MLRMQFLHALAGHVGVDLRGRQVAVTQQHLHHAQVGAVVQQVRGEGMPQRVRREFAAELNLVRVARGAR